MEGLPFAVAPLIAVKTFAVPGAVECDGGLDESGQPQFEDPEQEQEPFPFFPQLPLHPQPPLQLLPPSGGGSVGHGCGVQTPSHVL
jgi:hypothetical protein